MIFFVARDSWFVVRGSWFVVRGSWFVVRGSWSVVRGSCKGEGALATLRKVCAARGPMAKRCAAFGARTRARTAELLARGPMVIRWRAIGAAGRGKEWETGDLRLETCGDMRQRDIETRRDSETLRLWRPCGRAIDTAFSARESALASRSRHRSRCLMPPQPVSGLWSHVPPAGLRSLVSCPHAGPRIAGGGPSGRSAASPRGGPRCCAAAG